MVDGPAPIGGSGAPREDHLEPATKAPPTTSELAIPWGIKAKGVSYFLSPEASWMAQKLYGNGFEIGAFWRVPTWPANLLEFHAGYTHLWVKSGFSIGEAMDGSDNGGSWDSFRLSFMHVYKPSSLEIAVGLSGEVDWLSAENVLEPGHALTDPSDINAVGGTALVQAEVRFFEGALFAWAAGGVGFFPDDKQMLTGALGLGTDFIALAYYIVGSAPSYE